MDLNYLVRGLDGKEYGPVNLEQLSAWARERRLEAHAEIKRSDMEYWAAAGDFSELRPVFSGLSGGGPLAQTAPPMLTKKPDAVVASRLKSGGSWFFWIAGLSLVNSIAAQSGTSWRFLVGLGITQIIDAIGMKVGGGAKTVVLLADAAVASLFVLFGVFAIKGQLWAFIVGMVLFALDGLLLVGLRDWLGVGLHGLVLYFLYRGLNACRVMRRGQN